MRRLALVLLLAGNLYGADCPSQTGLPCPGGVVAADLAASDCASSDGSAYDLWDFTGTAGDAITIEMSSTGFEPFLILIDPASVPVAQSLGMSTLTYTLTSSGTWTIVANSHGAAASGNYTLSLNCPARGGLRRRSVRH